MPTVAALGRAMPFVRHELGKHLRLRRIPDLHVRLDDTAERGTRVLQLLNELEDGAVPDAPCRSWNPCPRRSRGSRTRATSPTSRRPPSSRSSRGDERRTYQSPGPAGKAPKRR